MASNTTSKVSSVLGATVVIVLLDLLLVLYVMAHGFSSTNATVGAFTLPVVWFPLVGVLVVALAAASDAFTRIFPRWLGPEADPTGRLRFLRVLTTSLALFVCVLYIPYLLGSNWFWAHLSRASHLIGSLQGFGLWLEKFEMSILTMSPVWQYATVQVVAAFVLISSAWALARPARRPRKLK